MGCSASSSTPSPAAGDCSVDFHGKYLLGRRLYNFAYGEVYVATAVRIGKEHLERAPSTGRIKRVQSKFSNCPTEVGVKIVDMKLSSVAKLATDEVARWKMAGEHENISKLQEVIYAFDDGRQLCYMIMDSCHCSLLDYLSDVPILNEIVLGEVFAQSLSALKFLHKGALVHRDIKPDAFTMGGADCRTLKLGDFGNSAALESRKLLKGECGSLVFMAPEMIAGKGYDEKVDMWSLGVLVYILLFGQLPFYSKETGSVFDMKRAITSHSSPTFASSVELSCSAVAFPMFLLERNPSNRLSAKDAAKKAYIVSAREGNQESDADLPCLKFALKRAKQISAFDYASGTDGLLKRKQLDVIGNSGPTTVPSASTVGSTTSTKSSNSKKSSKSANLRGNKEWCYASSSKSFTSLGSMTMSSKDTDFFLSTPSLNLDEESCQIDV